MLLAIDIFSAMFNSFSILKPTMDLDKRKVAKHHHNVNPSSYKSTNGNVTSSTVNIYSSSASSLNDITNGEIQQSSTNGKQNDSSKNSCNDNHVSN